MLPLYEQIPRNSFNEAVSAHAGLLFDKFPDGWDERNHYKPKDDAKKKFLQDVIDKYRSTDLTANLAGALKRQRLLIEHLNGAAIEASTDWRFVSGLGAAHPYETGFIWHRTLSVPYLPGSSVKGMMRAWAKHWGGLSSQQDIDRLFGAENGEANSGALIVFDALPAVRPELKIDILNPHYSEYYQDSSKPPADYLSPVPVFFLTVAAKQDFNFYLAPHPGASKHVQQDLEQGTALLLEALETLGAGGKTAVGYGMFNESGTARQKRKEDQDKRTKQLEDERQNIELEKQADIKGYTGLAKELYMKAQQENWEASDNTPKLYQAMPDYLQKIETESDLSVKQTAIGIIGEIFDKKFPGIMQEPEKKTGRNKDKFAYKDKPKDIAGKLLKLKGDAKK